MKTSKIIFISLLGTIALIILAAAINLRIKSPGTENKDTRISYKLDRKTISSFNVLEVKNSRDVRLVQGDSAFIEMYYQDTTIKPNVNFIVRDDTLKVSDLNFMNPSGIKATVHTTNSLNSIQLINSKVILERFNLGKLSMVLDQSEISFIANNYMKSSVRVMDVLAKNRSKFDLYAKFFEVDSLNLTLQNSRSNLANTKNVITGSLSDSSYITVRSPIEISLKKDSTSKITVIGN